MADMQEMLGFSHIQTINLSPQKFFDAFNEEAKDRKINLDEPSDQLDLSRDIILTQAALKCKSAWEIQGDTLYVWPYEYDVWPAHRE